MIAKTNILFIFLCFTCNLYSQYDSTDLILIKDRLKEESLKDVAEKKIKLNRSTNLFTAATFIPLFIYQKVFSEQISAPCEFDMSCSHFGINSIKTFGILKGVFLTADRLTRCNGQTQLESESYLINHNSGKTIDEPWMYRFKN